MSLIHNEDSENDTNFEGKNYMSYSSQLRSILLDGSQSRRQSLTHVAHTLTLGDGADMQMDSNFFWRIASMARMGPVRSKYNDDLIDRLNYQFTGVIIFAVIGLLGLRQYSGKPIQCWTPQEFTRSWEEYTENYCWVASTYYSPIQGQLPASETRQANLLGYYQWAPIVLALQAFLFYIPFLMWQLGMNRSIFNVRRILQMANEASNLLMGNTTAVSADHQQPYKPVRFIARYMLICIQRGTNHRRGVYPGGLFPGNSSTAKLPISSSSISIGGPTRKIGRCLRRYFLALFCCCFGCRLYGASGPTYFCCCKKLRRSPGASGAEGHWLIPLYLFLKLVYIFNIVAQLYLMNNFIQTEYTFFGVQILLDMLQGRDWHRSGNFPRVTFCDFEAKKLGKNHKYTLQCVLPLNMFLEKIYIFLWFWYVILLILTTVNFFIWLCRVASPGSRLRFVRHYLKALQLMHHTDKSATRRFVHHFLRSDGVLVLWLMAINCGDLLTGDVTGELWQLYRCRQQHDPQMHHMKMSASQQPPMSLRRPPPMPTDCSECAVTEDADRDVMDGGALFSRSTSTASVAGRNKFASFTSLTPAGFGHRINVLQESPSVMGGRFQSSHEDDDVV